jgi:hypothetical protein
MTIALWSNWLSPAAKDRIPSELTRCSVKSLLSSALTDLGSLRLCHIGDSNNVELQPARIKHVLFPIFGIGHEMKISGECRRRETVPAIDGGIDLPPIFGIAIKPHSSGAARGFVSASLLRRVTQKVVAFPTNYRPCSNTHEKSIELSRSLGKIAHRDIDGLGLC